jgi:hypothetical protein
MTDSSYPEKRRPWYLPLIFLAVCAIPICSYLWYDSTRYDLPKLKPYVGAQEDLFTQMKCLVKITENTEAVKIDPGCRFAHSYEQFWLKPKELDTCFAYSSDNATFPFDNPKRMEFDFMCQSHAMRAVFMYKDGSYRLDTIGMTFAK